MDLRLLQTKIGHEFHDEMLLQMALTHPSLAHDDGPEIQHNQRLEFLGDAVLQLVLTWELYRLHPELGEGPLTKARAAMVNQKALAEHARRLSLGSFLRLSRGEESHGGRGRASALADAFEAVLGALLLDGGMEAAKDFILNEFQIDLCGVGWGQFSGNPKGELQELLQATSPLAPEYHVKGATGPDHDRSFECAVTHHGKELARGFGKSKKAAETEAALAALEVLRGK
jgi:ribonuclease-3